MMCFSSLRLHPQKLKELRVKIDLSWKLTEWYELNPDDIIDFSKNAVIYNSKEKQKGDFVISEDKVKFDL